MGRGWVEEGQGDGTRVSGGSTRSWDEGGWRKDGEMGRGWAEDMIGEREIPSLAEG